MKKEEGWYYYKNGVMLTGWQVVNGTWYYMEENGLMASDTWIGDYYVDASGAWITHYRPAAVDKHRRTLVVSQCRWKLSGTYMEVDRRKMVLLDAAGYMVTGWQNIGGAWYYLDGSGAMATGWIQLGSTWYYMNGSGGMMLRMASSWEYLVLSR